jgi:hypothetical protein
MGHAKLFFYQEIKTSRHISVLNKLEISSFVDICKLGVENNMRTK